ncbi:Histone deacetylase HDT1 [Hibiscus syriacus]|uniref:Histone deacetylase HDT1 n=1 Tax=Hibiscus syriacus TaxID=106335 RepID=A0A6A3D0A3_HIBSY|nr:Histone deacetylase HDT1 [Hibiscus syriacus]
MEFWGIEVKAGQPIKADPGADYVIHLSQASLGESKNKADSVPLYVNTDGKKLVLGTLSHQNCPQLSFDLVFDQEFELSHNWKNGSVYFLGYKTYVPEEGYPFINYMSGDEVSSDEEEELPLVAAENGKAKADAKTAKANAGKPEPVKSAVKIAEPSKKTEDDDEDSEDEEDSDEMSEDDTSDEEDEETPKKVESSKKRPAEPATPASSKKAKSAMVRRVVTQQRLPSKAGWEKFNKDSKVWWSILLWSFGSEGGLDSHKKAKHGGK